ncbi:hypothetical protein FA09DRAFT_161571 [Tilletiopsis washingtonensis]|uniref:Uncharacterized protein n=1 Tax=Tilletiopsis washingtonensis TaxID=58919 RepID=A0A316Z3V5_9BASI|nr:hypothetical protein FA09DRAFT_161571 [Tilletiopsis washingtonensis]PWN94865.1 hypothetical protein FA09DRAFT_161571 [Tilletiopsis washingtonensis]
MRPVVQPLRFCRSSLRRRSSMRRRKQQRLSPSRSSSQASARTPRPQNCSSRAWSSGCSRPRAILLLPAATRRHTMPRSTRCVPSLQQQPRQRRTSTPALLQFSRSASPQLLRPLLTALSSCLRCKQRRSRCSLCARRFSSSACALAKRLPSATLRSLPPTTSQRPHPRPRTPGALSVRPCPPACRMPRSTTLSS